MIIKIYIKTAPTCFGVIIIRRDDDDCGHVPNSPADIHQQGPDNICSHTTGLTTPMYFN
jgi:hypothetical protein